MLCPSHSRPSDFFCLVAIFSVESKELELELELQENKIAIPVFIKDLGNYIQKKITKYVNVESQSLSRMCDVKIHVACLWICVLFCISFVCLHVCAYTLKFKIHCLSAPGSVSLRGVSIQKPALSRRENGSIH